MKNILLIAIAVVVLSVVVDAQMTHQNLTKHPHYHKGTKHYRRIKTKHTVPALPENSQQEYSQPENSQPENSQPEYSQSEYSQSEYSQPEYSQPEYTQQKNTESVGDSAIQGAQDATSPQDATPPKHTAPAAQANSQQETKFVDRAESVGDRELIRAESVGDREVIREIVDRAESVADKIIDRAESVGDRGVIIEIVDREIGDRAESVEDTQGATLPFQIIGGIFNRAENLAKGALRRANSALNYAGDLAGNVTNKATGVALHGLNNFFNRL